MIRPLRTITSRLLRMVAGSLTLLALAASPAHAAQVPPREFVQQLAKQPLDPDLRLQLARGLAADPARREEALEIFRSLLATPVGDEARRLLTARLVVEPPRRAWETLYRAALPGAPQVDAAVLRAHLAAIGRMKAPAGFRQPPVKAGADPQAAWNAAPTDAKLARAWANTALAAQDYQAALAPLAVALGAWPADRGLLGLYSKAALATGQPGLAVDRTRGALVAAPDAKTRELLLDDLVALEVVAAERSKAAEDQDGALAGYLVALATRPGAVDVVLGAAGLAWQAQDLEAAWTLYNHALALRPGTVDALLGAVTVGLSAGHDEEATRLVNAATSKDPRVLALRAVVDRAGRAKDARAAAGAGDADAAAAAFQALLDSGPPEAEFYHGLADALTALRRYEDAVAAWKEALRLDPNDAWGAVGEANALVTLGRTQEARDVLAAYFPANPPPGAEAERRQVLARSWRADAETANAAGRPVQALEDYAAALNAFPEVWGCVGVGGLYLEDRQPLLAMDFYDEALRLGAGEDAAVEGRALALEALGHPTEALAVLDAQVASRPSDENKAARARLAPRVAVAEAMAIRRAGDLVAAEDRLTQAIANEAPVVDLYAALSVIKLDRGDAAGAVAASKAALHLDPSSTWAQQVTVSAGRACGCTVTLLPALAAAVTVSPSAAGDALLQEATLDVAVQHAADAFQQGRAAEAASSLRRAQELAHTPDALSRVGGGWLAIERGREAQVVFERVLAMAPDDVVALVGRAGAMAQLGHMAAAERELARDFERLGDARLGLALARIQRDRGQYPAAARTLTRVTPQVEIRAVAAPPPPPGTLEAIPLPSGRAFSKPEPARPQAPVLLDLAGQRDLVASEVKSLRAPRASAGLGVVNRGGRPGWSGLTAVVVPIDTGPSPSGPVRLDIEVVPVHLDDVDGTDDAVAASVGLATPEARLLGLTARAGISPLGFQGGIYPVWSARLVARLATNLVLGVQTDRAPRADSRASWAGLVSPTTGNTFGRVSEVDGRAWLSWNPPRADLGLSLRGGFVDGLGVDPNPFGEGVAWLGRTSPVGPLDVRLGIDGIGLTYSRDESGFVEGQGGYFSPSLFLLGLARVDADVSTEAAALCAGAGLGPRYQAGDANGFGGSGVALNGTAHLGFGFRLARRWDLTVDGRGQLGTDGWHQVGGYANLAWGVPTTLPGAPPLSTLAAPGMALPNEHQVCRVAP